MIYVDFLNLFMMANIITSVETTQNCKSKNTECCLKVFRNSFLQSLPMFSNRLKNDIIFVRSPQNFHQCLSIEVF